MARGNTLVELDFFGIEKEIAASFRALDRRSPARGKQLSRVNPQLIRSAIAPVAIPHPLAETAMFFPSMSPSPMPVLNPSFRPNWEMSKGTAPLTIFYNGEVAVFDLPKEKVEVILKLAEDGNAGNGRRERSLDGLNRDSLPMARRKSLQRFFEKRKRR
ncbi:HLH [Musa troglodytarum]|nr:HLH [Musa troglodytarum]